MYKCLNPLCKKKISFFNKFYRKYGLVFIFDKTTLDIKEKGTFCCEECFRQYKIKNLTVIDFNKLRDNFLSFVIKKNKFVCLENMPVNKELNPIDFPIFKDRRNKK